MPARLTAPLPLVWPFEAARVRTRLESRPRMTPRDPFLDVRPAGGKGEAVSGGMAMAIGLYREEIRREHGARVRFSDGTEMNMDRAIYEKMGYQPAFDDLPTIAVYEARKVLTRARHSS
jgi:hypothetical protein